MTEVSQLRRLDAEARCRAQTQFDAPLVLEAGAGTGKTTALVARVAAWSLGSGWERAREVNAEVGGSSSPDRIARRVLSGIVAITFTEAAAAEMSTRVGEALHDVANGVLPTGLLASVLPAASEERILRARALRGALDHLVATTIHAWCRRLLVTHPLDAGLHAQLEIDAEGRLRQEVVREVLEPRLRDGYADANPQLFELAAHGIGPREIEAELLALLEAGLPARAFGVDPFSEARIASLSERLAQAAQAVCEAGAPLSASGAPLSRSACALAQQIAERLRARPLTRREQLSELVDGLRDDGEKAHKRLREWAGERFGVRDAEALGSGAERLAESARGLVPLVSHLLEIDVERLDLARGVFAGLLGEVEAALRARGIATFNDLIEGASRLLVESPRVAERVRAQIDQLLVDEFQDTDRRQCDLLRAVALAEGTRRPGLFVVGDPKQSIYGWRSADLTAYDDFVADVLAAGGSRDILYVNYRSVPAVLREVERVVAPVMQERKGIQPRFEPLVASDANEPKPGFCEAGRRPAEYWIAAECDASGEPATTRVSDAARIEAQALARDLRRLHEEHGVPWSSFGVLFRSRSDWDLYLAALREHGVPFAVEGDRSYYRRREIVDAAALVRCALDPNDHLALLTLLRSAAVGVPDAALLPLWAADLPAQLTALQEPDAGRLAAIRACVEQVRLPDDVPGLERVEGWQLALIWAAEALAEIRRSAREDPADVFVETLRTSVLLEAGEAARFQGAWRAANLDRFFRVLLEDLEGGADFHRVLRRLRTALADEQDAEEGRPVAIREDAVQILTIHGAKGLDFEHVYVMQLHKGPPPPRRAQVELRSVEGILEYRVLGAPSAGWDRAERERTRVEEAERVRTLYVAMTRAKQRLVLSGLWPHLAARGARSRAIDLVAKSLGDERLRSGRAELFPAGAHEGLDETGARWMLPVLAPEPSAAGAHRERVAELASEAEIEEASRRLQDARRSMRARMALPLGAAASADPHENPEERAQRGWSGPDGATCTGRPTGVAAAVGTAVHRALESLDLDAEPGAARSAMAAVAARSLRSALSGEPLAGALTRAQQLLERFSEGPLEARLRTLAPHIVARELPVLALPDAANEALGYVSGAIDLVYTDPRSGRLVVADYKTGARGDYARQGAQYCRALRGALDLDYEPRFELWYLEEGEIAPA